MKVFGICTTYFKVRGNETNHIDLVQKRLRTTGSCVICSRGTADNNFKTPDRGFWAPHSRVHCIEKRSKHMLLFLQNNLNKCHCTLLYWTDTRSIISAFSVTPRLFMYSWKIYRRAFAIVFIVSCHNMVQNFNFSKQRQKRFFLQSVKLIRKTTTWIFRDRGKVQTLQTEADPDTATSKQRGQIRDLFCANRIS